MTVWVWIAFGGATLVAAIIFSVRLRRRGTRSLEADFARGRARIRHAEDAMQEEQNKMTAAEHLQIARAGLEDLLRLSASATDVSLEVGEGATAFAIVLPGEILRVGLSMRECLLRGGTMVRRRAVWHLQTKNLQEEYEDLALLMHAVSLRLDAVLARTSESRQAAGIPEKETFDAIPPELPHLARRFVHVDRKWRDDKFRLPQDGGQS